MRKMPTVLAAAALLAAGMPSAQAATAPTINRAAVTINNGDSATLDRGDRFVLRFSKNLAPLFGGLGEPGIAVTDAAGRSWAFEPGTYLDFYGAQMTVNDNRLTVTHFHPEQLVLPLTIVNIWNIAGRNGVPVAVGTRDTLID